MADPATRFHDVDGDYYDTRVDTAWRTQNRVRQPQALRYTVTRTPA